MAAERAQQMIRDFAHHATCDFSQLSRDELAEVVLAGEALRRFLETRQREAVAEFERQEVWQDDGATSAANWLAARTGRRRAVVRREVRLACSVAAAPAVAEVAPQLSSEHLQLLASCRSERTLAAYERDEQQLIDAALSLSVEEFSQVTRAWLVLADPDGSETARRHDAAAARVHLSRTLDGWWVLSGLLAPDDGEVLHAALEAGVDRRLRAAHDGDPSVAGRPVAAWRAQALIDLASNDLRREPSEHSAPDRYRIGLLLRPSELRSAPPTALCDSDVYRLVIGARSEVLDVGRSTPIWPPGMRRFITARDRGCVFPGCDRPPSWCDIHHCKPWSKGGHTAADNGALLCRAHHTFIHRHSWNVVIDPATGIPQTYRPDGTLLTLQRHPPPLERLLKPDRATAA